MVGLALSEARKVSNSEGLGYAIIILIILLTLAFGIDCLIVWAAMALWNGCLVAVMPMLAEVGYWQMWGIYLLTGFLFRARVTVNNSNNN